MYAILCFTASIHINPIKKAILIKWPFLRDSILRDGFQSHFSSVSISDFSAWALLLSSLNWRSN